MVNIINEQNEFVNAFGFNTGRRNFNIPTSPEVIAPPSGEVVTWDSGKMGATLVLDGTELIVTKTANSWQKLLATYSKSTGKHYFEIRCDNNTSNAALYGVSDDTQSYAGLLGALSGEWGYRTNGQFLNNNTYSGFQTTFTTGDVVGIAVNMDTSSIWVSVNGVFILSGDPAAGTNASYTNLSATVYPAGCLYYSSNQLTARFKLAEFTYTPPSDFSAWGI